MTYGTRLGDGRPRRRSPNPAIPCSWACGIDVFKTARHNGFDIDTCKETLGRLKYFALVLIE